MIVKTSCGTDGALHSTTEDWLLREDVARGLRVLEQEDKVFDCLVRPPTLKHVATIGEI